MRKHSGLAAVGIILLLAVVSSCTSELPPTGKLPDPPSSTAPTSDTSPPSSVAVETPPSDQQQIESQYKAAWEFMASSGGLTDQQVLDGFSPYAAEPILSRAVTVVSSLRAEDKGPRGSVVFSPLTISVTGDSASVTECRDTTTELMVQLSTGAVLTAGEPNNLISASMVRGADRVWKFSEYGITPGGC